MKINYDGISIEGDKDEVIEALEKILEKRTVVPGVIDRDPYEKIPYWERPGYRQPQITCGTGTGQNPREGLPQVISVYGLGLY